MAIYLVQSEASGLVKIGYAADVLRRLPFLQTGSADALRLVRLLDGSRADEAALHKRFAGCRKRGEWFALPADVAAGPMPLPDLPLPQQQTSGGKPGRPLLGQRPMTATERSARRRQNQAARIAELEAEVAQLRAQLQTISC